MEYQISKMEEKDWEQVRDIFIQGIQTGNATFDTDAPSWEEWDRGHIHACRLVVSNGEKLLGWAALSQVSSRRAFAGIAELSIYLSVDSVGKGIGSKLIQAVIESSEAAGFWTLQSGIFPENTASIHLHKKVGFREIGVRKQLGKMNGRWRDVVMMERRSEIVGIE
ncbi:GNAT family N-acetyltransferase [Oceanobacillus rekensis]|uniref:GNAT family N-acetyltransferase n=1 Tax=Oceanobacillus rekensis TaxID=937927 RepID=UPI000B452A4F|nr:GNAT family N-acetyltransferase [Oceanobacillus rekensis]